MSYLLNNKNFVSLIVALILFLPALAQAQEPFYTPMVDLPGYDGDNLNFNEFINQLYIIAITLGAMLAVIKIIIAGVKWMMSDIAPDKSSAKKDIRGALVGLLIIISAALILETINPALNDIDLTFERLDSLSENDYVIDKVKYGEGDCIQSNAGGGTVNCRD